MKISLKSVCLRLHLWLGLVSGIFVFIVCITGCLYVFKDEILDATEPWRFVKAEQRPAILPQQLIKAANAAAGEERPVAITYGEAYDAVKVDYRDMHGSMKSVFLNPYTGNAIKVTERKSTDFDFFNFIIRGHMSLWLPRDIGAPIVSYSVLVFFITLVTGLVILLPHRWSKAGVKRLFVLRRPFKAVRLTTDLHNVIGFYALLPLFVLCLTGMMFGLDWFSRSVYAVASGGNTLQPYSLPSSDTVRVDTAKTASLDILYRQIRKEAPEAKNYYFTIPEKSTDVYRVSVVHKRGSYYRTDNLFFDRYTLKPLRGDGPYAGKYDEVPAADRMIRMNMDIHDGRIFGFAGKLIMCLASLVGASLPITGYLLWKKGRRRKNKDSQD